MAKGSRSRCGYSRRWLNDYEAERCRHLVDGANEGRKETANYSTRGEPDQLAGLRASVDEEAMRVESSRWPGRSTEDDLGMPGG